MYISSLLTFAYHDETCFTALRNSISFRGICQTASLGALKDIVRESSDFSGLHEIWKLKRAADLWVKAWRVPIFANQMAKFCIVNYLKIHNRYILHFACFLVADVFFQISNFVSLDISSVTNLKLSSKRKKKSNLMNWKRPLILSWIDLTMLRSISHIPLKAWQPL